MMTNERQYRITKGWLERFTQTQVGVDTQSGALHPRAALALHDQYESQIEELRAELVDYETLHHGEVMALTLDSLAELPDALIRAQTAAGSPKRTLPHASASRSSTCSGMRPHATRA